MDSISIFDVFAICEVEVGPTSGGSQVQLDLRPGRILHSWYRNYNRLMSEPLAASGSSSKRISFHLIDILLECG